MCLSTSTNPITASRSACSISSTPSARIASPPMPVSLYGAPAATSARATPEACRSPEASPATNRMSRTDACRDAPGEGRERALDVDDDLERHGERLASRFPTHGDGRLATHRREEALELQSQRLALVGAQRDPLDELLQCQRCRRQRRDVDVTTQAEELALAAPEIEREIAALLEDAQLAHALA